MGLNTAALPPKVVVPAILSRYWSAPVTVSVPLPMVRSPTWMALPVLALTRSTLMMALLLRAMFRPLVVGLPKTTLPFGPSPLLSRLSVPPNRLTSPGVL